MNSKAMIEFNGTLIPLKIGLRELENNYNKTKYRNKTKRNNTFKTQSRNLVYRLAKAYKIKADITINVENNRIINNENANVMICVKMKELKLEISSYAQSKRKAWRLIALKTHKTYKNLIKYY